MKTFIYNAQTSEVIQREMTPEEIAQMQEIEQVEIPYDQRVVSLIRSRYSIDDEIAINRQKDAKPDEWQEYYNFCEMCKQEAKGKI